ncbi:SRPBCC family protein [Rhodobacter sp. KR11]|uniref:SRPBCC family protein n=1 Tax=Rhodobacter sp. KR11 TaxID=2974588 RepID=UPI00222329B3|nr:SRPBCC family protein [Rhodobacter sp. KR11]MCW1918940.1 SRPBCC family protein [Rhodobacter sp. KR11]
MKLVARYDVDVPVNFVWAEITDFEAWERMAMRRGAEVTRTDRMTQKGAGMAWALGFAFRGQARKATLAVHLMTEPEKLTVSGQSALADVTMAISLMDLTSTRTRIEVKTELKPRTIAARLYVQGLKLARKKVERQYANRISQLAVEIEDRFRRPTNLRDSLRR